MMNFKSNIVLKIFIILIVYILFLSLVNWYQTINTLPYKSNIEFLKNKIIFSLLNENILEEKNYDFSITEISQNKDNKFDKIKKYYIKTFLYDKENKIFKKEQANVLIFNQYKNIFRVINKEKRECFVSFSYNEDLKLLKNLNFDEIKTDILINCFFPLFYNEKIIYYSITLYSINITEVFDLFEKINYFHKNLSL